MDKSIDSYGSLGSILSWLNIINENDFTTVPEIELKKEFQSARIEIPKIDSKSFRSVSTKILSLCSEINAKSNLAANINSETANLLFPAPSLYEYVKKGNNEIKFYIGPGTEIEDQKRIEIETKEYVDYLISLQFHASNSIRKNIVLIEKEMLKLLGINASITTSKKSKSQIIRPFSLKHANDASNLLEVRNKLEELKLISVKNYADWNRLFSGKIFGEKINWLDDKTSLKCFLKLLKDLKIVKGSKINKIGAEGFLLNGNLISEKILESVKGNEHELFDQIAEILKLFNSQIQKQNQLPN